MSLSAWKAKGRAAATARRSTREQVPHIAWVKRAIAVSDVRRGCRECVLTMHEIAASVLRTFQQSSGVNAGIDFLAARVRETFATRTINLAQDGQPLRGIRTTGSVRRP